MTPTRALPEWIGRTPDSPVPPRVQDAIEAAARKRERLNGQSNNRPTWAGGRQVYA